MSHTFFINNLHMTNIQKKHVSLLIKYLCLSRKKAIQGQVINIFTNQRTEKNTTFQELKDFKDTVVTLTNNSLLQWILCRHRFTVQRSYKVSYSKCGHVCSRLFFSTCNVGKNDTVLQLQQRVCWREWFWRCDIESSWKSK